jgi:hypothetical protein
MNAKLALSIPTILLFSVGCSTVSVNTDYDKGTDFSRFKTFSQKPPPQGSRSLKGYSEIAGRHINSAIATTLESKGFQMAPEGQDGDLIVAFSIDGQPRQDVEWTGGGYGGWYGQSYTVNYVEGTLTIDVFDASKRQLVWHAYGQTNIYGSQTDNYGKVDDAVEQILKKFPPQPEQ